jgi:hypothetical protein
MKMEISYKSVVNSGKYREILRLPTYQVWQNTETFHTVLFFLPKSRTKNPSEIRAVWQYSIPGLASDSDISIPAGMWREWVKGAKKITTSEPLAEGEGFRTPAGSTGAFRQVFIDNAPRPTWDTPPPPIDQNALDRSALDALRTGRLLHEHVNERLETAETLFDLDEPPTERID